MSALLQALRRVEDRVPLRRRETPTFAEAAAAEMVAEPEPQPELAWPVAEPVRPEPIVADDFAEKLTRIVPAASVVTFLSCGPIVDFTTHLRELAGQVSERLGADVVLLGPGMLDAPDDLVEQWRSLKRHAAYAFLHASVERLEAKLAGIGRTAGVVLVVELGRTSASLLEATQRRFAERRIPLLGSVVLCDETR